MNLGTTILQRLKSGVNLSMAACIRPIRNPQKQFPSKKEIFVEQPHRRIDVVLA